jgi:hypothetical protein
MSLGFPREKIYERTDNQTACCGDDDHIVGTHEMEKLSPPLEEEYPERIEEPSEEDRAKTRTYSYSDGKEKEKGRFRAP